MEVTRLAPSPTGALHLGNARTFLLNWLLAKQSGWKIILRIEDLDGPRIKRGADQSALEDLQWLGLNWDIGPVWQSQRMSPYTEALQKLLETRHAYPCTCTRREVELAASAPHAEDGSVVYAGTCRGKYQSVDEARAAAGREPAIRFAVPQNEESIISWEDEFSGAKTIDVQSLGDFVIAKGDGTPAYQLAVVTDDASSGVTRVVRGDDLIDSTPRQILLYQALGLTSQIPTYCHLPLIVGSDGRRLAKRHGDSRISFYRSAGVTPQRILKLLAEWCGIRNLPNNVTAESLVGRLELNNVPPEPIVFSSDADRELRGG